MLFIGAGDPGEVRRPIMTSSLVPAGGKAQLIVAGNPLRVPDRTASVLFVSHEPSPSHRSGIGISISLDLLDGHIHVKGLSPDEPSTIYTAMVISQPSDATLVPRPDYFPSYAGLTPEQKWIYLDWLTDVTQAIDVGYVFIYYYGLERHLLIGDFDAAFDEIILLRHYHAKNPSFDSYSRAALLNSALFRKRPDRLEQLYRLAPPQRFMNSDLILAHQLGQDLGPEGMIRLAESLTGIKKRYIKSNPEEYKVALAAVLSDQFDEPYLPLASAYKISEIPRVPDILFANISFPTEVRTPDLPSFLRCERFVQQATGVLNLAHERTKRDLAAARKKAPSRTR